MKSPNRLIPLLAAALAAPLAFAQSTTPTAQPTQDAAAPAAQSSSQATPAADPAAQGAPAAPQGKAKNWSDVDSDKDGKISKTESASEPAVGQIFDQADADKDGNLTTDEYKAYIAKANGAPPSDSGG